MAAAALAVPHGQGEVRVAPRRVALAAADVALAVQALRVVLRHGRGVADLAVLLQYRQDVAREGYLVRAERGDGGEQ